MPEQAPLPASTSGAQPSEAQASESMRWRYGLYATIIAVVTILAAFVFASLRYPTANDVSTALAAITGTLGTILGAYLGVQSGSQGKEASEAAREKAQDRAEKAHDVAVAMAMAADYNRAMEALASLQGRSAPEAPGPRANAPSPPTAST